jgi:hypothetical protein
VEFDRGSTLHYLVKILKNMDESPPYEILRYAIEIDARHSVRFLTSAFKFDLTDVKCSEWQPEIHNWLQIVRHGKRSKDYSWTFYLIFWVIYLTNVFIINPKLDVWYFVFSTTTVSLKLFFTFRTTNRANPGFLYKELDFLTVLRNVKQEKICPRCKVVRTDTTVHCPVMDRCVDRYDSYSKFACNAIGRGNHGFYFAFIFFFWLDTFLVGWIDGRSIPVTECDLPSDQTCPLDFLCVGGLCHVMPLHYFSVIFGAAVCLMFYVPT